MRRGSGASDGRGAPVGACSAPVAACSAPVGTCGAPVAACSAPVGACGAPVGALREWAAAGASRECAPVAAFGKLWRVPGVWAGVGLLALAALTACVPHARAPVMDRSLVDTVPDTYEVRRHDTLYSIAWRHNLDYKALAKANGIAAPYGIVVGQRLRLTGTAPPAQPARVERRSNTPGQPTPAAVVPKPKPDPVTRAAPIAKEVVQAAPPRPAAKTVAAAERSVGQPAPAQAKPQAKPTAKPAAAPPPKPRARVPVELATVAAGGWRRPVAERPVRRFGGASKGFDYDLKPATSIHAASGGIVVYAGPGLGGFRHLVIVKASDRYLVAYGVNVAPALREGETVLPGTVVAKIDSGGSAAGKFHFEIRDRGTPVDPGKLLPG